MAVPENCLSLIAHKLSNGIKWLPLIVGMGKG